MDAYIPTWLRLCNPVILYTDIASAKLILMEGWSLIMYDIMDAYNASFVVYFVLLILVGPMFTLLLFKVSYACVYACVDACVCLHAYTYIHKHESVLVGPSAAVLLLKAVLANCLTKLEVYSMPRITAVRALFLSLSLFLCLSPNPEP